MPAIADKTKGSKKKVTNGGITVTIALPAFEPKTYLVLSVCGGLLGLSAPGLEQWYLAWFGLVPLLLASVSSAGIGQAFLRGYCFGMAYNLVYLNWYLGLQPLDWLNFNLWQGWALATIAWLFVSNLQAVAAGLFSAVLSKVPMTGSFLPRKAQGQWKLPALLTVPLLWTLIVNFIGNAHCVIGVPWTMLEYSQYRQLSFIQIASIIGGVGIGFLIVMTNTAIAAFIAAAKKGKFKNLAAADKSTGFYQILALACILTGVLGFGFWKTSNTRPNPDLTVSVLQGNINIEMQKTRHRYTLEELVSHYFSMLNTCPSGLVVWTESSLPTFLREEASTLNKLAQIAHNRGFDMVIGSLDREQERPFNSAYGITSGGKIISEVYHKRYLVPFGEYTPVLVQYMPAWVRKLTNTPAGGGFQAGQEAVAFPLTSGRVSPLICFETLSPEMVASSVRKGGQLLVNVSDLAWFHESMTGRQMIAFSVLRAIENGRYFVFAANTGPSAIIDSSGRILSLSKQNQEQLLVGKVSLSSQITPFTRWFVF